MQVAALTCKTVALPASRRVWISKQILGRPRIRHDAEPVSPFITLLLNYYYIAYPFDFVFSMGCNRGQGALLDVASQLEYVLEHFWAMQVIMYGKTRNGRERLLTGRTSRAYRSDRCIVTATARLELYACRAEYSQRDDTPSADNGLQGEHLCALPIVAQKSASCQIWNITRVTFWALTGATVDLRSW